MDVWKKGIAKIPECKCLQCGAKMNASGSVDGNAEDMPEPGSVVLCIRCGGVMKHADDMSLRGMSEEEMDELTADKEWMDLIARTVQKIHFVKLVKESRN